VQAKAAGVDVLESNETPALIVERHQALVDALEEGTLPVEIFKETEQRLTRVREQFRIGELPEFGESDTRLRDIARDVAARSIIAVNGTFEAVDDGKKTAVIDFNRLRHFEFGDPFNLPGIVREGLTARIPNTTVITMSHDPQDAEIQEAQKAVTGADTLVLLTRDAVDHTYQAEIGKDLIARSDASRVIHVAMRGPYDAGIFGDVSDTLLTFGDPAVTVEALVNTLAGA
jgi:hypothetical protein